MRQKHKPQNSSGEKRIHQGVTLTFFFYFNIDLKKNLRILGAVLYKTYTHQFCSCHANLSCRFPLFFPTFSCQRIHFFCHYRPLWPPVPSLGSLTTNTKTRQSTRLSVTQRVVLCLLCAAQPCQFLLQCQKWCERSLEVAISAEKLRLLPTTEVNSLACWRRSRQ